MDFLGDLFGAFTVSIARLAFVLSDACTGRCSRPLEERLGGVRLSNSAVAGIIEPEEFALSMSMGLESLF